MGINRCKVWNWKLKNYIIPKRVTSKGNQPVYQWLWWQIAFENQRVTQNPISSYSIAWSNYFKSYIKIDNFTNDKKWSFYLCDIEGNRISPTMSAKSSVKDFKWIKSNSK